jgi:hypothetical protein
MKKKETKIVKFPVATDYLNNPTDLHKEIKAFIETLNQSKSHAEVVSISATSLFDGTNGRNAAYLIYTKEV